MVGHGGVAQLGERLNGIQEVMGSTPTVSTPDRSRKSSIYADFRVSLCLKKVFPQGQKVFPHPEKDEKWGFYPQMACETVAAASGSGVFSTYS